MPPEPVELARRRAVADLIADQWRVEPNVGAVLCSGSTGRGQADRWSDLEMMVVWSVPPATTARQRVGMALGGEDPRLFSYDADGRSWFDEWWWCGPPGRGLLVETTHVTEASARLLLDQLLEVPNPQPMLLTFASALAYGVPLVGSADALTERVRNYPRAVAVEVVQRLGQIDHFWRWQMYLERGNPHGLRRHFAAVVDAIVHIVHALNGRWWAGSKWPVPGDLRIAPPSLAARLAAADRQPPDLAAGTLAELVGECYDLVAAHLREVDVRRLRAIFGFAREPWPNDNGDDR